MRLDFGRFVYRMSHGAPLVLFRGRSGMPCLARAIIKRPSPRQLGGQPGREGQVPDQTRSRCNISDTASAV